MVDVAALREAGYGPYATSRLVAGMSAHWGILLQNSKN
jgi:hypothetical protein